MRGEHAANRALIRGSVGVAADGAKHGTRVQTCTASNAMQDVALLGVGEELAAAVIEENDVKFFGAVGLVRAARPTD